MAKGCYGTPLKIWSMRTGKNQKADLKDKTYQLLLPKQIRPLRGKTCAHFFKKRGAVFAIYRITLIEDCRYQKNYDPFPFH